MLCQVGRSPPGRQGVGDGRDKSAALGPGKQSPRAHAGKPVEELRILRLAIRGGRMASVRSDRARGGGSLVVHWWTLSGVTFCPGLWITMTTV